MKKNVPLQVRILFVGCLILFLGTLTFSRQVGEPSAWRGVQLPFRVLNITSRANLLWVRGTDETIAVSSDEGSHWEIKHQKTNGDLLLNIEFADSRFGYAAGTGGLILTTEDGGETWSPHFGNRETILQVSFSDMQHGLIRTPNSLLFTLDGGTQWLPVSEGQNVDDLKEFPYTFSLVALDFQHMAVMLKQGTAQYEHQALLYTQDSGKSWKFQDIPNVTLYSFLRVENHYWAVGTEVIHKDQPGGGYAVPVALYSSDGDQWNHSTGDLSSCKLEMCTVCSTRGCFSSNGVISSVFSDKPTYRLFPGREDLTTKWASTDSTVCFVGTQLQCSALKLAPKAPVEAGSAMPTITAPDRLGGPASSSPRCILCSLDRLVIDQNAQGAYTLKLALEIAKNGTVTGVEVQGAPTPAIKSRIEEQVRGWLFEPYLKDGVPLNVKLNTNTRINVIKPR